MVSAKIRCSALLVAIAIVPGTAEAYVGPGAGFALLSSVLVVFTTMLLAIASLLVWPFRAGIRLAKRRSRPKPWIKRLIVVGFDGQDPKLTDQYLEEGRLPNLERLKNMGCYSRLQTTYPALSPVAWSSFATGTNPARHNIFDFLNRDRRTYLPLLSSTHIGRVEKTLKIGRYRIPLKKPELRQLRKSKPFWSILGEHDIWSTILRVPITFPPDKFYGAQISAMCVPDLLGTQGTFLLYTTRPAEQKFKEGGIRVPLEKQGTIIETTIRGPDNTFIDGNPPMEVRMQIEMDEASQQVRISIDKETVELAPHELSDWVQLTFKAAPGVKVSGICRMMITEMGEHFSLYVTPICLDPENPAMPISHPSYYSTYMAKKIGRYCTLGLAEDTWALNEGVTDDGTFLTQTYDIDGEREQMFFAALDKLRRGTLVCVFDATDRIQHMFWHYLEEDHPANKGHDVSAARHRNAIREIYEHNDKMVGRVMEKLQEGDVLLVISDHGFDSFQRGVNLNGWLMENGYLVLKEGATGDSEWLVDVDWSKTKAYCLGLTGMFLNLEGREAMGIVEPGKEAQQIKDEIISRLNGLVDDERGKTGIQEVFDTRRVYQGPYSENAPDLIIGYNSGYRISWNAATGMISGSVFEDNVKAWSGDHCIDPRLVPGVLFSNYPINAANPGLIDIAPSALRLFGLEPPAHMDGKPLFTRESLQRA
ncbi:MAG: alkaline phosphatase family protein [Gammaproteobacteria bacterium]|nr:alkaline phosphatase family protein [Gammaproteobacteria bacterium]